MTDKNMPDEIWAYDADAYENRRGWSKRGERMDGTNYTRSDIHEALRQENEELQAGFDMCWKADQRAIKKWHEAGGDDLTWPDQADLCVWLLERDAQLRKLCDELAGALEDIASVERPEALGAPTFWFEKIIDRAETALQAYREREG